MEKIYNNKIIKILRIIFQISFAIYCLFVWSKIVFFHQSDRVLIYAVIPTALFVSLINRNNLLILIGETITIAADCFLILYNKTDIGMTIFIFAQLSYAVYFFLEEINKKTRLIIVLIRLLLIVVLLIAGKLFTKESFNLTVISSMIYFANLIPNLVCCIIKKNIQLIVSFTLFLFCDICVGLVVILPDGPFRDFLNNYNLTHIFYIPSQLLIAFTSHNKFIKINN